MTHFFFKLVLWKFLIANIKCQILPVLNETQTIFSLSPLEIPTGNCDQMEENIPLKLLYVEAHNMIVNDGFMNSPVLNCLDMERNQITEISPAAFKFLPNLCFLNLARNFIPTSKLISFNGHMKLKTLILDENVSDTKNANLTISSCFPNLRNLYLRKNGIRNISLDLTKLFPNLTHLYLSENKIKSIDLFSSTLTHIYLEKNSINKFSATMIKNMEYLALNENKIETVCNTYCHEFSLCLNDATNLKYLSLYGNGVIDIEPDSFDDTVNLKSLDLSKNNIDTIRKGSFKTLINLQNLSISNNNLNNFPNFSSLTNLQRLNLSNNKLETVQTGELKNLFLLKTLVLSNNLLTNVEVESFKNLMSLEDLDLSNNKLRYLPKNWFTASENLRILDLRENCFADLGSLSLENVESLEIIFLQKNPIKYLNTGSMIDFPKNVSIYLENEYGVKCSKNFTSKILDTGVMITPDLTDGPSVKRID